MKTILLFMAVVAVLLMFIASNASKDLIKCLPEPPVSEMADYQELSKEESCVATKKEFDFVIDCLNEVRKKSFLHKFFYEREKEHIEKRRSNHNKRCAEYPTTLIQ